MAGYNGNRRFYRKKARKPLKAMAKKARYKKSASAQSRQIAKLARHVSSLKDTVKEDTSMRALYTMTAESPVKLVNNLAYCSHIIVPLTAGINQNPDSNPALPSGQQPVTNLTGYGANNIGWIPIFQPRDLKPGTGNSSRAAIPPWVKLYNQHCKLRFWSNTIKQPTDITVSVLRARNDGPVGNVKSIAKRLDGPSNIGPQPSANDGSYIAKNRDYTASDGLNFNQATTAAGPPGQMGTLPSGSTNIQWNRELWEVHYQKQFTLGVAFNPLTQELRNEDDSGPSYASEDKTAIAPAFMCPTNNLASAECQFTLKYGGLKLSTVPPLDGAATNLDPMVATDSKYQNIPSEHKYFLVISSSDPQVGASVFCPYMQFSSQISARVPI